ncbi:MAG TPA: PilZ domain-containing protein [Isosphaeraceae bacterium]|nr:PilZ domain-containing protein [Isosphaeraceae bacterium]
MFNAVERRSSARRGVVKNRMILRFTDSREFRRAEATLLNISSSGALIATKEKPTLHQPLWITMESPVSAGWIEAVPVRYHGEDRVGLAFRAADGCGSHFLWAATSAMDLNQLQGSRDRPWPSIE